MEFNMTNELLKNDAAAMDYFNSLDAEVQKRLLDRYTGAESLAELKSFAETVKNQIS